MSEDPAKLSLSNFLAGETNDPLEAPPSFTNWMRVGAWAVKLYEPELLATADARTTINYGGQPKSVINLCSYNYLGLANHPDVIAAAHEALRTHGLGPCGSPMLSGMTDLHRELERRVEQFLQTEAALIFNSGRGAFDACLRPNRSRRGGEIWSAGSFPARLRHIFKSNWGARGICRRIKGDSAIPTVLRAPLCLFVCASPGRSRGHPQGIGDRH